jgi:hypothetical protein
MGTARFLLLSWPMLARPPGSTNGRKGLVNHSLTN